MRFPGFIGPGYTLQSLAADCQRCVGWYPEINELQTAPDGEIGTLVQCPGHTLFGTYGNGPIRATYATSTGALIIVSGDTVYRVGADGRSAVAGTLFTSKGPVCVTDNGKQIFIGDGDNGYLHSMVDFSFVVVAAEGFSGAVTAVFQDGYFIVNPPNTNTFNISDLYDGLSWSGLDFGAAEGSPDNIVAVVSNLRHVWLFGELTTEIWWDSGDANFPFTRVDGAFIEYGCAAPFTAQKFDNSVIWLGAGPIANGVVWQAQGFVPKRISNHAVEYAIQQCADLSTATAYTYQFSGHSFYVLNLPDSKTSWVYDSATDQWHERQTYVAGSMLRQRAENHALVYGKHLVGDYRSGNVYVESSSVYTDYDAPLVRIRRSPHLSAGMRRVFYSQFLLDATVGIGLDGNPATGFDPQIMLSWSDDYGFTWSSEISMSLGKLGQYRTRVQWNRLGMARNRVFQVRVTDPVGVTLLGAELDFQQGAS